MMKVNLIDLQEHKKIKTETIINWITFKYFLFERI